MIEKMPTRDAYGHALLKLAQEDASIMVMDADLSRSTRTEWIGKEFPDQFINCGIAEQNMMGMAAGLSFVGFIPFATTYAIFIGRAYDQIRQAIGFSRANVKIVATHAGLAASHDGGSHQGVEDIALMRVIPGMTVLSPADYNETKQAVLAAARHPGPVYIRLQKEAVPNLTAADEQFQIGKAHLLRSGCDVALLVTGSLVGETLLAADHLRNRGFDATVVNVSTIKPLDEKLLHDVLKMTGCAVVIEEHSIYGGLYESVTSFAAGQGIPIRSIVPIGIEDKFGQTGDWLQLREAYGLSEEAILAAALGVIRQRPNTKSH